MVRSRTRLSLAVCSLALASGCDSLSVKPFVGTVVQLTFASVGPSAPGTHLELWTRDQNNTIVRVDGTYFTYKDPATKKNVTINPYGLQIRNAVDPNDPCLIDSKGNLLTSPDGYKTLTVHGVTETPEEQAEAVVNRIKQITATAIGGNQMSTLLAVGPPDDTPLPTPAPDATAAERLQACQDYWNASPTAYTGNPAQQTAPIHGEVYGFVSYTTTTPPSGYDGIRIDSPTSLKGTEEVWLSVENVSPAMVSFANRGPVFLEGKVDRGGNDVLHFDLTGPNASGTAALLVNLDDSSVSF